MKFLALYVLVLCTCSFGHVNAQKVTLDVRNVPFQDVALNIQKQTGYSFSISKRYLDISKPVSIKLYQADINTVLEALFKNQPFSYSINGKVISLIDKPQTKAFEEQESKNSQQQEIIRGRVTDSIGSPIPNVTVTLMGSHIKAMTDAEGYYELLGATKGNTLLFTSIGYQPSKVEIINFKINVQMQIASSLVETVNIINTGYQSLPKERATGSFSYVGNNLLNQKVTTNIIDRLEGNVPGLIFHKNTTAGSDGGTDINIRGHSTLFANDQPLIIVDNFPYDGPLSNINPNDVDNITILRDAAAASIWGVRAGNGVIVITSKKGIQDAPVNIEFNSNLSIGGRPDLFYKPLERITPTDRLDLESMLYGLGYYSNRFLDNNYPAIPLSVSILDKIEKGLITEADGYNQLESLRNNDVRYDLQKYFYQPTVNQQYAINLRGGSRKIDYYVSAGYDDNRSPQVGFANDRFNLMSNLNLHLTKQLTISTNVNLTNSRRKTNSVISDLNTLSLFGLMPEYTDLVDNGTGNSLMIIRDYNPTYLESLDYTGFKDWYYRPYDELGMADDKQRQSHIKINLGLDYKIIAGLSATLRYQYEGGNTKTNTFHSADTYYTRDLVNRFYNPAQSTVYPVPNNGGILMENHSILNSHRGRIQLDYKKDWNQDHQVTALMGSEISEVLTDSRNNILYGYNPDNLTFTTVDFLTAYPNNPSSTFLIPNNNSIGKFNDRYLSYFANGSYSYRNRYTLSVSGRVDKSNLFGVKTNQKTTPLYSLGISWDISQEDFYKLDILPFSKLRYTYGYSGNIDKSASAYNTFIALSNSILYGLPFAQIQRPGNDRLRWEKVRTINLGYDFATNGNRLSGSLEFYSKNGIDLFGNSQLAGSTGFTRFYGNTANTTTKGFDIVLNSLNVSSPSFKWNSNLIMSRALDIVTDYKIEENPTSYLSGIRSSIVQPLVGKPLFAVYSYAWAGLSHENGDPQGYVDGEITNDWAAILSNTTINNMVYNGPARPLHFGAFRNTFSYKDFSVSANLVYKLGYYFRRNSINYGALYGGNYAHTDYYKRWQNPGDELSTSVPSIQPLPVSNARETFYTNSEVLIEKGDHIRLQDVSISYSIPYKNISKFKSIRFYGTINNVGIVWKKNKHNVDPDVYGLNYPTIRLYSIGVHLSL